MSNPDPILIGLAGRAGAGKDTAAHYLTQCHGFVQAAFADVINDMAAVLLEAFGEDYAALHERHLKEQPLRRIPGLPSARQIKQQLGDFGRSWASDFWVRALAQQLGMDKMPESSPVHDRIVISDVRFPNEAAWIASHGGLLLRLRRPQAEPVSAHGSEDHVDGLPVCMEIVNDTHSAEMLGLDLELALSRLGVKL